MSKLDDEEKELRGCLWQVVLVVPTLAYLIFVEGFVLSKLWAWYAVPLGARPLHWHVFAMGVAAYGIVRSRVSGQKDTRSTLEQAAALLVYLAGPWIVLLLGWWWA